MQRIVDFLKDEGPTPEPGEPVWILGHRYDLKGDTWSEEMLNEVGRLAWLMYRTQFATPIPRHPDGPSPLLQNVNAFMRSGPYAVQASVLVDSFTSDVGWGCMIRTGQSLIANALLRIAKSGPNSVEEIQILRKFSDDPKAPYSIHRFVEYGALKCGKLPGQWFGPSAVAACIAKFAEPPLNVYVSSGADVFEQDLLKLQFPILVLCGLRLGIQEVNPIYYAGLQSILTSKHAVGIAGGRTSASHYFYGFQNTRLFYHDPHEPKPSLAYESADAEFVNSMHSKKLRALNFSDMDPSMLAGFVLTCEQDFVEWKLHLKEVSSSNSIVNITDTKPSGEFVDDMSDGESVMGSDAIQDPTVAESPCMKSSSEPPSLLDKEVLNLAASGVSYVECESISQEAIVNVNRTQPEDESTIEVRRSEAPS